MNKILALLSCFIFVLVLAGCGRQSEKMSGQPQLGSETQEDEFPEFLVGVWEAQSPDYNWGIKFEPDGSILKIIHHVAGQVRLEESGIYGDGPEEDTYYVFIMGPCEADYIPSTGVLKVKVVVDYFRMKLPTGELEGKMEDYFEGPVSEDGRRWDVSWRNYTWVEGADPPDPNAIDANPELLVFAKIHVHGTE